VKPATTMAIGFFQNAEDLEPPDDMLYRQSDLGQSAIIGPLGIGERMVLAGFFRCPGVGVLVVNTLRSCVGKNFRVRMDGRLRLPQESKIMRRTAARNQAENPVRDRMYQELHFQRMALLFPAIPVPLLFLERAQGTSLTSTTTAVPAFVRVVTQLGLHEGTDPEPVGCPTPKQPDSRIAFEIGCTLVFRPLS